MTLRAGAIAISTMGALLLAAITLYDGTSVINAPTDVFILIGQAWRMALGQVPHADFGNPIGVVTDALVEAGMAVGGRDAGGLAVCLGLWLSTGVDPLSYLGDVLGAAQAQSVDERVGRTWHALKDGAVSLALLSVAWAALVGRRVLEARRISPSDARVTVQLAFLCAAAVVISAGNTGEGGEVPLFAFAGLVLLANADVASRERLTPFVTAALAASILSPVVVIAGRDIRSIADTTLWRRYRLYGAEGTQRIAAPALWGDFVIPSASTHPTQYWAARDMPGRLNDGLALLRRHLTPESRVFTVALTDEFSFPLGLAPPTGGPLWWDRHLSYAPESPPPADKVFHDVTLIMIPVLKPTDDGCCRDPLEDIPVMYADYWSQRFVQIDTSPSGVSWNARRTDRRAMRPLQGSRQALCSVKQGHTKRHAVDHLRSRRVACTGTW